MNACIRLFSTTSSIPSAGVNCGPSRLFRSPPTSTGQPRHPGTHRGGKTEAAFFPVLSQMLTESWEGLSVLYVSPIKALLNNQEHRLAPLLPTGRQTGACGTATRPRGRNAGSSPIRRTACSRPRSPWKPCWFRPRSTTRDFFQNVRAVVIDELHAFAGDDRGWHLLSVFARIQTTCWP